MSSSKIKGLLRGLRYISQIFDNEKEEEIQIGCPTDVKHVAHIGWDGPSVNTPSWKNEFKSSPGFALAPLNPNEELRDIGQNNSVKWVSEDSRHVNSRGLPELPTKEKSNKSRQLRKSSKLKDSLDESNPTRQITQMDALHVDGSSMKNLPDIPKKSRPKKLKNNSSGYESSKLRSKGQPMEPESPSGFVSKSRNKQRCLKENEQYERRVNGIS